MNSLMKRMLLAGLSAATTILTIPAPSYAQQVKPLTRYEIPTLPNGNPETAQLPARRSPGAVVYQDKLYVAGGHFAEAAHDFFGPTFLSTFQAYDLKTGGWTQLASKNKPGRFSSLAAFNGYLYCFGGFYAETPDEKTYESYLEIERYDIAHDRWEILPIKLAHSRSQHAVIQIGSKVYVVGGWNAAALEPRTKTSHRDAFVRPIEIFDLETETFLESKFELPETGRRGFSAFAWNNQIVVAGGFSDQPGKFLSSVVVLDPNAKNQQAAWKELPSLPTKIIFPMIVEFEDALYLLGGTVPTGRESSRNIDSVYVLKNGATSWESLNQAPAELVERTLVRQSSDQWLLLGGRFADDRLSPDVDAVTK